MAFWSDTSLDPKRQYKFKITFGYISQGSDTASTYLAQSADRPVYTISDGVKVDYLDKQFNFPGKITWTPVKIKFVDAVGGANVSRLSYNYLAQAGWINPQRAGPGAEASNMGTINKSSSVRTSSDIKIQVLNSGGSPVDTWTLRNAFITTVALNNLDYSAEGILTAEYNIRYDWADFS